MTTITRLKHFRMGRARAGAILGMLLLASHSAAETQGSELIAFTGVNVISMTSPAVLEDQSVLVENGKVLAIGPADLVEVPAGAQTIQARGRYLMPGLADMHAHISPPAEPAATPELLLYLATGVTTLRNMAGMPGDLALKDAIAQGQVLGPRLMLASPLVEGEDAVWDWATKVLTPEEGRAKVREFASQGYDVVKIYHTLDAEVYRAIIDEGKKTGIRIVGHVPFTVGVEEVIAAGQSSIEHLRGYDIDGLTLDILAKDGGRSPERFGSWLDMSDERMADLARQTACAGTWNTPTIVVNAQLANAEQLAAMAEHPMARYMTPEMKGFLTDSPLLEIFSPESREMLGRVLPQMRRFVKALHDAGAPLMIGTDTVPTLVPGYTVVDEIGQFVQAGLTPYEALYAATVEPARFIGDPGSNGTLTVGQRTDLILLAANPLEDVSHLWQLEGVVVQGAWHTRQELLDRTAQLLDEAAAAADTE